MNYLKDTTWYEELYDHRTVEICRQNERLLSTVYEKARQDGMLQKTKTVQDPDLEIRKVLGVYHYFYIEYAAGERWQKREKTIQEWMENDKEKDRMLEDTQLAAEPR